MPPAIQTPDRSGLPSAARGTGLARAAGGAPLGERGAGQRGRHGQRRGERQQTRLFMGVSCALLTAGAGGRSGGQLAAVGEGDLTRGALVRIEPGAPAEDGDRRRRPSA